MWFGGIGRSIPSLCYWRRNDDFFYWWLLDYPLPSVNANIYSFDIWGIWLIIYFYILCQHIMFGPWLWTGGRRIIFKVVSVVRHRILRLRGGLWDFIELKCVSVGRHQIAPVNQLMELVMVC